MDWNKKKRNPMMGSKPHFEEVKNEFVGEEHESDHEDDDQMTIHQFLVSKGKRVHPFPSSDASPEVEQNVLFGGCRRLWTGSRTKRRRCSAGIVDNAFQKGPRGTRRRSKLPRLEMADSVSEIPLPVMDRAEEVQARLDPKFPSFVKIMLPSHVVKGFWLGLLADFCKAHLTKHDAVVTLEDEDGEVYKTKFLTGKLGLSGGWKAFAVAHNLLVGDAVVFQLRETCKFKVFIVRANSLGEVDGALALLHLDRSSSGIVSGPKKGGEVSAEKHARRTNVESDLDNAVSSTSFIDFKNFSIVVNGHVLDSEIPPNIRLKYYELCRAQKSCLHSGLQKSICGTLAAGIISEIVAVADAVKASSLSTRKSEFAHWDKTLAGFELLGFDVGILRSRIGKLSVFASDSVNAPIKSYKQAKLQDYLCGGRNRCSSSKTPKLVGLQQGNLYTGKSSLQEEMTMTIAANVTRYTSVHIKCKLG